MRHLWHLYLNAAEDPRRWQGSRRDQERRRRCSSGRDAERARVLAAALGSGKATAAPRCKERAWRGLGFNRAALDVGITPIGDDGAEADMDTVESTSNTSPGGRWS